MQIRHKNYLDLLLSYLVKFIDFNKHLTSLSSEAFAVRQSEVIRTDKNLIEDQSSNTYTIIHNHN